jgi:MFS family permease
MILGGIVTQQYFDKKRGLAGGIVASAAGTAFVLGPLFARYAVDSYGWRGTMLIMSGIMLNGLPLSVLLRPFSGIIKSKKSPEIADQRSWLKIALSSFEAKTAFASKFSFLLLGIFFYLFGHLGPYTLLALRAIVNGMSPQEGATLLTIQGLSGLVGRFGLSALSDICCLNRVVLYGMCFAAAGSVCIASYFISTFPFFIGFAVLYGCMSGKLHIILPQYLSYENVIGGKFISFSFLFFFKI